jgi:hypothetical protein
VHCGLHEPYLSTLGLAYNQEIALLRRYSSSNR